MQRVKSLLNNLAKSCSALLVPISSPFGYMHPQINGNCTQAPYSSPETLITVQKKSVSQEYMSSVDNHYTDSYQIGRHSQRCDLQKEKKPMGSRTFTHTHDVKVGIRPHPKQALVPLPHALCHAWSETTQRLKNVGLGAHTLYLQAHQSAASF